MNEDEGHSRSSEMKNDTSQPFGIALSNPAMAICKIFYVCVCVCARFVKDITLLEFLKIFGSRKL